MPGCAVYGCRSGYNASNGEYQMFVFPKAEHQKNQWIEQIARSDYQNKPGHRVCSKHFTGRVSCI